MDSFFFYVDKWLSSTHIALMSAVEERGFLRLLLHAAKMPDCGLPDDDEYLARIALIGSKRWASGSGQKLRECFFRHKGRLFNATLLREFAQHQAGNRALVFEGKLGAEIGGTGDCQLATDDARQPATKSFDVRRNSEVLKNQCGCNNSASVKGSLSRVDDDEVGVDLRVLATPPENKENPKNRRRRSSPKESDVVFLRKSLASYMAVAKKGIPDDALVTQVLEAGGGATVREINDFLVLKYEDMPPYPLSYAGPKTWAWFPVVVRNHFKRMKEKNEAG